MSVYHGTVTVQHFDIFAFHADVVALGKSYFGSGSGAIYLDSVVCNGSEGTLQQCAANPIGVHNCDHSEDAGVRCGGMFVLFCFLTCTI